MSNQRLTDVLQRLTTDGDFLSAFRGNPEQTLEPYGLSEQEIAAVKEGDERKLTTLGADLSSYFRPRELTAFPRSLLLRLAPIPLALALIAGAAAGSTGARAAPSGRWARRAGARLDGRWDDPGLARARARHRALYDGGEGRVGFKLPFELMSEGDDGDVIIE